MVHSFLPEQPRTFPPPATSFTVNTTTDAHAANPAGGVCADSGGQCSIRAALEVANATNQTITVNIPAGTYTLSLGALDATDTAGVQLVGAGASTTTITGPGGTDVFDVTDATANGGFAGLTNLTVSGGEGIGVDADNAVLIMSGATVANASGINLGAGVHNDGQLWATTSTFTGNSALEEGGALFNDTGSVRLSNDTFTGNTAGGDGGAIYNDDGTVAVDNSTFTLNSVDHDRRRRRRRCGLCRRRDGADERPLQRQLGDDDRGREHRERWRRVRQLRPERHHREHLHRQLRQQHDQRCGPRRRHRRRRQRPDDHRVDVPEQHRQQR